MSKSYSPPTLNAHQKAALESGAFEFLLPSDERKLYSIAETAVILETSQDTVRRLVHNGSFEVHGFMVKTCTTYLVTRRSIARFLAATSNYAP